MENSEKEKFLTHLEEVERLIEGMNIQEKIQALKDKHDMLLCHKLAISWSDKESPDLKKALEEYYDCYGGYFGYNTHPEIKKIIDEIHLYSNIDLSSIPNISSLFRPSETDPDPFSLYKKFETDAGFPDLKIPYTVNASESIKTSKPGFWKRTKEILGIIWRNAGTILFWLWFTSPITLLILVHLFKLNSPVLITLNKYSYSVYVITGLILAINYVVSAVSSGLKAALPNGKVLGMTSLDQNHFADAIASFQQYLQENPDDRECMYLLGLAYDNNHQEDMALSWYNALLEKQPYHAEALNNKGRILYTRNDLQNAKICFERAAEMGSSEAMNNLKVMHRYGRD
jgi:tetratricopeptide (TPR) repeat protein